MGRYKDTPSEFPSLYVISAGAEGPVKIGISKSPIFRLKEIQPHSPMRLRLLKCWPMTSARHARQAENIAHMRLRNYRSHGEWFLASEIAAVAAVDWARGLLP